MGTFYHSPSGIIDLDGFTMTLSEFQVQRPTYSLPAGLKWRRYANGAVTIHIGSDGENQTAENLENPWPDGDEYIANKAAIEAAVIAARPTTPPAPTDAEAAEAAVAGSLVAEALIDEIADLTSTAQGTVRSSVVSRIETDLGS